MTTPDTAEYNALKEAAPSLPAAWYVDAAHHVAEMRGIWQASWVYVCRANDLSEAMAFRTVQIGDQSIVVLRDAGGVLRAFHNVCRHRGSVLCTEHEGRLAARLLVCPYHQWAYAPDDGRLVKTSSFEEPAGFDKKDYGLFKVALAEWRGCVFVHLDPEAQFDEARAFQRPPDNLVRFPLEGMVTGHVWTKELACNWKVFWENFNECLHCPNIHPELVDLVPLYSRRIMTPMDMPGWEDHEGSDDPRLRGGMRDGAETWSMDGDAQGHLIAELDAEDHARGHTYATAWPSVFVAGYPDHVRIVRMLPLGPERTEIRAEWLFQPETLADPGYDIAKVVDFAVLVMEQDGTACEWNQRGLHAAPLQAGVLMPEEYVVKRFQDWVRGMLGHAV